VADDHRPMRKPNVLATYAALVGCLLPGDVIHHVAPTSAPRAPSFVKVAAIDEARAKRRAKLERRAKQAGHAKP
jgi:hypothetical protein